MRSILYIIFAAVFASAFAGAAHAIAIGTATNAPSPPAKTNVFSQPAATQPEQRVITQATKDAMGGVMAIAGIMGMIGGAYAMVLQRRTRKSMKAGKVSSKRAAPGKR